MKINKNLRTISSSFIFLGVEYVVDFISLNKKNDIFFSVFLFKKKNEIKTDIFFKDKTIDVINRYIYVFSRFLKKENPKFLIIKTNKKRLFQLIFQKFESDLDYNLILEDDGVKFIKK